LLLLWTVTKIVLIPVVMGIILRRVWTPGPWVLEGVLPTFSIFVIAWIVGVIVGLNQNQFNVAGVILIAVIIHNALGLGLGYWGSGFKSATNQQRRTVSIEVGMQNSGLAVALAIAHFGPMAAVPGAIFSLWHNVTGPLLATLWRRQKVE
jgi:BASS family bile acid:Na+ symporter